MKKILLTIFSLMLIFTFAACGTGADNGEDKKVHVVVPDGAPALSIAKLVSDNFTVSGYEITYEVVSGVDILIPKVTSGEADLAIVPTNNAVTLSKSLDIKLLSVNTHGNLYLLSSNNTQITDFGDLKGKVIYSIGAGGTPQQVFEYLLSQSEVEFVSSDTAVTNKVAVKYVLSPSEIIAAFTQKTIEYAIIAEPAVTQAINKLNNDNDATNNIYIVSDIQTAWDTVNETEGGYPQSVLISKTALTSDREFISAFLAAANDNTEWLKQNPAEAKTALTGAGSTMALLNTDIVNRSNVRLVTAVNGKAAIEAYLTAINIAHPASNFYYA